MAGRRAPTQLPPRMLGTHGAAGHNCLKAELVVTCAEWPLREKFLAALRAKLGAMPNRVAYYPGSHKKHAGEGGGVGAFPKGEGGGAAGRSAVCAMRREGQGRGLGLVRAGEGA